MDLTCYCLELLQNADDNEYDDNSYPEFSLRFVDNKYIWVTNNEKV